MFKRVVGWLKTHKTLTALIATAVFVAVHVPLVLSHEPWYDEIVPWELSKQITPANYYEVNSAEPHPPLWQVILAVFSQAGAPVQVLNWISLVVVALAVFLLWRNAPFGMFAKLVVSLSMLFFYFNPVIARDYALIPLAVVLLGMAFPGRVQHPLRYGLALAFLLQTHFLMWGLAGALGVEFLVQILRDKSDKVRKLPQRIVHLALGFVPAIASAAVCVPTIIGCLGHHVIITSTFEEEIKVGELFDSLNSAAFGTVAPILAVIAAAVCIYLLFNHTKWLFVAVASVGYVLFTMLFIYNMYTKFEMKTNAIMAIGLFLMWVTALAEQKKDFAKNKVAVFGRKWLDKLELVRVGKHFIKKPAVAFFILPFLFSIPHTLSAAAKDLGENFDESIAVAEVLNGYPAGSVFVAPDGAVRTNLVASSPFMTDGRIFYDQVFDHEGIHIKLDEDYTVATEGISDGRLRKIFAKLVQKYDHVYYIARKPGCESADPLHIDVLKQYGEAEVYDFEAMDSTSVITYLIYKIR